MESGLVSRRAINPYPPLIPIFSHEKQLYGLSLPHLKCEPRHHHNFDDLYTSARHMLKFSKAVLQRGWLIISPRLPTHLCVTHGIRWTDIMRMPGPRMYSGPSRARRLGDSSADFSIVGLSWRFQLWLAPPTSV
jgi:hypothetical protein